MDVMIDLETYSNTPNSAIVQIGAVIFDRDSGTIIDNFKTNVDAQSCIDLGMEVNIDTINWWMSQPDKARKSILKDPKKSITLALKHLKNFIYQNYLGNPKSWEYDDVVPADGVDLKDIYIWCHSTFDEPILSNAYRKVGMSEPWHYRSARDLRTLIDLANIDPYTYQNNGTHHDALADCRFQVKYTVDALKKIGGIV